MTDKVAIILSGCGVFDGSEIHEASAACGAVTRSGKKVVFYAPDKTLHHEINHISGESNDDTSRNVRIESGRIARGKVNPLADLKVDDVDAVIIPGGFGAAKNLSTFATSAEPNVDEDMARVLREFHSAGKPIALCCIAPIVAALVLAKEDGKKIKITLGQRSGEGWPYAQTIDKAIEFGVEHEALNVDGVCVDEDNKLVTTPAYMFDGDFHEIHDGVAKMVEAALAMI